MSVEILHLDDDSLSSRVAANVRAEAARAGYNQSSLARALRINQPQVHRRWRGQVAWSLDELEQVAAILRVDELELLAGSAVKDNVPSGGSHRKGLQRAWRDSNPQPSGWYPSEDASSKVIDLEAHRLTRTESRLVYIA